MRGTEVLIDFSSVVVNGDGVVTETTVRSVFGLVFLDISSGVVIEFKFFSFSLTLVVIRGLFVVEVRPLVVELKTIVVSFGINVVVEAFVEEVLIFCLVVVVIRLRGKVFQKELVLEVMNGFAVNTFEINVWVTFGSAFDGLIVVFR